MTKLPTGTVTFLFTDIEGSTRTLLEHGDRYAALLETHAEVIRAVVATRGGIEVNTEGDAFFVVFTSPAEAVRAAAEIQRGLAGYPWPHGVSIRVRIGLHTGEGVLGADDYVGLDVHRAARVARAGHGGEVLLSETTRSLVTNALPAGASLRDLGPHRLKDLDQPERLFQLVLPDLPSNFPPPRTLDARPNNLPAQLTSFIGRAKTIREIERLLEGTRLLTLTGAGGSGKTRLALELAHRRLSLFEDGAFMVELAPIRDPALVPSRIAESLGVPQIPGRTTLEVLEGHLRDRDLLLLLDNFEQVTAARDVIENLLTAAPKLKILVTSREVLSLRGEQEFEVPSMESPDLERLPDVLTLGRFEAVRLFTDRAAAARPSFRVTTENASAVAGITARLDGLPLAIELAATRIKLLNPEQILVRLQRSLAILTSGALTLPERQRTLRGAIAWSYDLLDEPERRLFARLSVFTGGWTLESAEAVCDPGSLGLDPLEGLTSLVDKSLVRKADPAQDRFSMLETIREFGQEQLQRGDDLEDTLRRHGEYFLRLALEAEPRLTGEERGQWLDRCEREHPNFRAALSWAIEVGQARLAQELAGALWRFWEQRGHLTEGRRWFDDILAMPSGQERTSSRAKALTGAGVMAWWQMDLAAARSFYGEALAVEQEQGDPARIAEALLKQAYIVGSTEGDIETVVGLLEESLDLFRSVGDDPGMARVLSLLARRDASEGDWDPVIARAEEAVAIWRRRGERYDLAYDLIALADAYGRVGRGAEARSAALEALELFREVDNPTGITLALLGLSFVASWEGRFEEAIRLAGASARLLEQYGGGMPSSSLPFPFAFTGDPEAEPRAHLSDDVARRAREEGWTMTVDQAVALAREEAGA
jgi:predicted ATPase/class 3 adenylate cyclase